MIFSAILLACFGLFVGGMYLFRKGTLPPQIDSLRQSRAHYVLFGIGFAALFPQTETATDALPVLRMGVINMALMWFGVRTGLGLDLQHLRRLPPLHLIAQVSCALFVGGFAMLAALAGSAVFTQYLGILGSPGFAVIFVSAFVLSTRFPEPTFRWWGVPRPPSADLTPTFQFGNSAALLLLAVGFAFFAGDFSIRLGPITFAGYARLAVLLGSLGLLGGIAMDFVLRAHSSIAQGMALAFAIMVALAGMCESMGIPALAVGFLAGVWLVNVTVVKRDVLEHITRAGSVVEPLFFFFIGTLLPGTPGQPFFHLGPIIPFAIVVLLVRVMGRILGFATTRHLWQSPTTWDAVFDLSMRPLGRVSVALAIQSFLLLPAAHHTQVAGLILAAILSQVALFPPIEIEKKRGLMALSSRD